MRKHISLFLLATGYLLLAFPARAGVPEATTYLAAQPQDEWITQALVAAGQPNVPTSHLTSFSGSSATDYAKRILAIAATKHDPASWAGVDLVAGLRGLANSGQIGDPSLLNDDAWGILALRAAGLTASDEVVADSAAYLLAHQNADGGWGYALGVDSDSNDTAAVLMALSEVGKTSSDASVASAVAYLATQQLDNAGFVYQLPCSWPGCDAADSASTAWVIAALTKLYLNPASWVKGSSTPFDFLLSLQTDDGSFKWQLSDPAGTASMTAYAVVALSSSSYPVARFTPGGGGNITPVADMELNASAPQVMDDGTVQYTLTLTNHGPTLADRVIVSQVLPTGVTVTGFTASDGEFDAASNTWQLVRLNNYATATLQLTLTAPASASYATTASETQQEFDFNVSNNSAAVSFFIPVAPAPVSTPSLSQVSDINLGEQAPPPQVLGATTASCAPAAPVVPDSVRGSFVRSSTEPSPTWYVSTDGAITCLDSDASVRALFEKLALGITNANLAKVSPGSALAERLKGRLLLQVESLGEVWYINPADDRTVYLPPTAAALALVQPLSLLVP